MYGDLEEKDKNKNVLVIFPSMYPILQQLLKPAFGTAIAAKKESSLEVSYHDEFYDFAERSELARFFQGDHVLLDQLEYLQNIETSTMKLTIVKELLAHLRTKHVSPEVSLKWISCLEASVSRPGEAAEFLSSLLSLGGQLVPRANWNSEYSERLKAILGRLEPRATANAIEVFAKWGDLRSARDIYREQEEKQDLTSRHSGNLILAEGVNSLSEDIFERLREMLNSEKPEMRDSGTYAACALMLHLRAHSMTELSTYDGYHDVRKILADLQPKSERLKKMLAEALVD